MPLGFLLPQGFTIEVFDQGGPVVLLDEIDDRPGPARSCSASNSSAKPSKKQSRRRSKS